MDLSTFSRVCASLKRENVGPSNVGLVAEALANLEQAKKLLKWHYWKKQLLPCFGDI